MSTLKFHPFTSVLDPGFWSEFANNKLSLYKLDDSAVPLVLSYTNGVHSSVPPRLCGYAEYSYAESKSLGPLTVALPSSLRNYNTIDEFKGCNKADILNECTSKIWDDMMSLKALEDPSLLGRSSVISFADLKKWNFTFWLTVPLLLPPSMKVTSTALTRLQHTVSSQYPAPAALAEHLATLIGSSQGILPSCFFYNPATGAVHPLAALTNPTAGPDAPAASASPAVSPTDLHTLTLVYVDPLASPEEQAPHPEAEIAATTHALPTAAGWGLSNVLLMLLMLHTASLSSFPSSSGPISLSMSVLLLRDLRTLHSTPPAAPDSACASVTVEADLADLAAAVSHIRSLISPSPSPTAVPAPPAPPALGWERHQGRLRPRVAALSSVLDAAEVAKRGVKLNIELMKWRMLPSLDTDRLANTRCLLIGAGTLGCNVARLLLAWGHTRITMLDSGDVAHSNPVRQSLYTLADVGKPKAEAACEALKRVHPAVTARAEVMSVPMPGHHAGAASGPAAEALRATVVRLARLVSEHDVVFLLTDSRESRWLPAMLAAAYGKPCVNAALGFDSYLVMRHGQRGPGQELEADKEIKDYTAAPETEVTGAHMPLVAALSQPPTLSCYFCIDITAPGDSLKRRTLDQQCTVTRPGLAYSASALAVEMHVALLHARRGALTPALIDAEERQRLRSRARESGKGCGDCGEEDCPGTGCIADDCGGLGGVPHQVRGHYSDQSQVLMKGSALPTCCCCGGPVQQLLKDEGVDFVLRALAIEGYLEQVSGLAAMIEGAEDALWDDDEDDF